MKKILIADHADTWREVLREILEQDYQVFDCADGAQACKITEQERPDVLVLDLMLPGKDVLGILKELSSFREKPRTVITGRYVSDHVHAALERYRVDLIMMKPCEARNLAERISELLSVLAPEEAEILKLRFGLEGGLPMSPEETGRKLGLTAAEVVAKEAAALAKLRN